MNPWALPSALALSLVGALALYVARHGAPAPLERPLLAALAGAALFALADFAGFLAAAPVGPAARQASWVALLGVYGGLLVVVPSWWLATLRLAQVHERPFLRLSGPVATWGPVALAGLFLLLAATNPWHGLFLTPSGGPPRGEYGPGRIAFAVYGYGTIGASFALLLSLGQRTPSPAARAQVRLLALACALPTVGSAVYLLAPAPLPFNPTSLGLAIAAVLFVHGIDRRQLFTLSPKLLGEVLRQDAEPVFLLDGSGALVHANPAACAWLELPASARPPDTPERLAARLRDRHGGPVDPARLRAGLVDPERNLHALFRSSEGAWLRLSAKALPDRRGHAALVVVRLRDESELHRTAEAFAEQAATLEAVLSSSGDGILVVDWPAGDVRYVNEAFVGIVGMRRPPEVGDDAETVRRAVHAAIREPEALDDAIGQGQRDPRSLVPLSIQTRDGRVVEGSARGVLRGGRVVARLFQVRDVTEQRRAEDSVRLSQKLESLSVMAGGIAHDFNNLLVSVLGNAEVALDLLPEEAEARAPLRDVEAAAERARELTRQLLAYAGRTRVEPEEADLSAMARDVLSLLGVSIPKNVQVETSLAATPPAVVGDPGQLRQVAMNLVLNAAEATAQTGGVVRVETGVAYVGRDTRLQGIDGEVSANRPLVFLRVSDDGPGMDEETRERIFDPFFSTKRTGRGLGLAASMGIVRSHGGTLQVESAAGGGSVFTVLLPSTGAPVRVVSRPAPEPATAWRGDGCILVVDDEPGVLRVARRILECVDFEVEIAEDGVAALERYDLRGGGYRAVLLDLTMPRLSGEETLRELRKRDPALPVLLSSGYPEAQERLPEAGGGVAFVAKPYTKAALLDTLRRLLETARGSDPGEDEPLG